MVESIKVENMKDNLDIIFIIQMSDLHIGEPHSPDDSEILFDFMNNQLKHISPSRIVLTGDITDSPKNTNADENKAHWIEYRDIIERAELVDVEKIIEVPGNHDSFGMNSYVDPEYYYCQYAVASTKEECIPYNEYQTSQEETGLYYYDITREKELKHHMEVIELNSGKKLGILLSNVTPLPSYGHLFGFYGIVDYRDRMRLQSLLRDDDSDVKIAFQHQPLSYVFDSANPYVTQSDYSKFLQEFGINVVFSGHIHTQSEFVTKFSVPDVTLGRFTRNGHLLSLISVEMNSGLISYSATKINTYPIVNVVNPPNAFLFNRSPVTDEVIVTVVYPPGVNNPLEASKLTKITVRGENGEERITLNPMGDTPTFVKAPIDTNGEFIGVGDKDTLPIITYAGKYDFKNEKGVLIVEYEINEEINSVFNVNPTIKMINKGSTVVPYSNSTRYSKKEYREVYPKDISDNFHPYPKLNSKMFTSYLGLFTVMLSLFMINIVLMVLYPLILFIISKIKHIYIPNVTFLDIIISFFSYINISLYLTKTEINHMAISVYDHLFTISFSGYIDSMNNKIISDKHWIKLADTGTVEISLIITCIAMWGYHAAKMMHLHLEKTGKYEIIAKQHRSNKSENMMDENIEHDINIQIHDISKQIDSIDSKEGNSKVVVKKLTSECLPSSPSSSLFSPQLIYTQEQTIINSEINLSKDNHPEGMVDKEIQEYIDTKHIKDRNTNEINEYKEYKGIAIYVGFMIFFTFVGVVGEVSHVVVFFVLYSPLTYISISSILEVFYVLPFCIYIMSKCYKLLFAIKKLKLLISNT